MTQGTSETTSLTNPLAPPGRETVTIPAVPMGKKEPPPGSVIGCHPDNPVECSSRSGTRVPPAGMVMQVLVFMAGEGTLG